MGEKNKVMGKEKDKVHVSGRNIKLETLTLKSTEFYESVGQKLFLRR